MSQTARYALRGDDGVFYGLQHDLSNYRSGPPEVAVLGDGKPLEWQRDNWWKASAEVARVEIPEPDKSIPHGWELPEGVSLEGCPARCSDEELSALEVGINADLYQRVYREEPQPPTVISAEDWTWLEGEPPPNDPRVDLWRPNLPAWLQYGREFSHVFPGVLVGFIPAMKPVIEAMVDGDVYKRCDGYKAFAKFKYSPPRFHEAKPYPRSRRRVRRESTHLKEIFVSLRPEIPGTSLADALLNWDKARREAEDYIKSVAQVKICAACSGSGIIGGKGDAP